MIGRYSGPTAAQRDWNRNRDNHEMTSAKHRVDRRTIREIDQVAADEFPWIPRDLWFVRITHAVAVVRRHVREFHRRHPWTNWREDLFIFGVAAIATIIAVPLAIVALEAWAR